MESKDNLRELCIQQGYVPKSCKLDGMLVMGLIQKGENPCWGCNHDRSDCGGCSKKLLEYNELSEHEKERYNNYTKEQNLRLEKEQRGYKRLSKKSNELIMDISTEYNHRGEVVCVNIKDRIKENCYSMKLNENIDRCCDMAIMFIEKFKIKEVHIDGINRGICLYDCLSHKLEIRNIDWCDVINFDYKRLDFDTHINDYDYDKKSDDIIEFAWFDYEK